MSEPKGPKAWAIFFSKVWGDRFPVEPDVIALEYSARYADPVRRIEPLDVPLDEFEGGLFARSGKWLIVYNRRIRAPGRKRFTVAHEFGHYMLHRQGAVAFRCSQNDILDRSSPAAMRREHEANEFASYLLMPIGDFRRQMGAHPPTLDLIAHCADRYGVSLTAAALKYVEFTERRVAVVVGREGFILWGRASDAAYRSGIFWRRGDPLPAQSLAAKPSLAQDGEAGRAGVKWPPGVWRPDEEVVEMSLGSDAYDLSISLLVFPNDPPPRMYSADRSAGGIL